MALAGAAVGSGGSGQRLQALAEVENNGEPRQAQPASESASVAAIGEGGSGRLRKQRLTEVAVG